MGFEKQVDWDSPIKPDVKVKHTESNTIDHCIINPFNP